MLQSEAGSAEMCGAAAGEPDADRGGDRQRHRRRHPGDVRIAGRSHGHDDGSFRSDGTVHRPIRPGRVPRLAAARLRRTPAFRALARHAHRADAGTAQPDGGHASPSCRRCGRVGPPWLLAAGVPDRAGPRHVRAAPGATRQVLARTPPRRTARQPLPARRRRRQPDRARRRAARLARLRVPAAGAWAESWPPRSATWRPRARAIRSKRSRAARRRRASSRSFR